MALPAKALTALAWVAPRAAMSRAQALAQIEAARTYQGASVGRRAESFTGRSTSANTEIGPALSRLRNRSRELGRNTAGGRRVLDVKAGHAIGSGITIVPDNGSDRIDNQVRQELADWIPTSDIEGVLDFNGQQKLAYTAMCEGGDSVIRKVPRRLDQGQRIPLKLQVLEGDYIDSTRDRATFDGMPTRLGVALGDWNERKGLWLHPDHPGEMTYRGTSFTSKFVPQADVIHLFNPLRPGQVRGVPIFAPVLMTAQDQADLFEAVLVKAKTEACFSAFIETTGDSPSGIGQVIRDTTAKVGRLVERLAPGLISYLRPGEKVSFAQPTSSGQFEAVWLAAQMLFAAGTGITHDQLTGDLRQANYSSLRAGKIEFRRLIEQEQTLVIEPMLLRRVMAWWTETALMAGVLRPRKGGYRYKYVLPAVEPIDPLKDLEADILAVRSGRMTPQDFLGSWGLDWRKALEDFAKFFEVADRSPQGLVFDIDPRKTTKSGVAQTSDKAYPTDEAKAAPAVPLKAAV